ncbi:hypothetical protein CU014_2364 [Enterococcus xinjiangensis]|nr:hypothetical protein [Enterococcus lactis]
MKLFQFTGNPKKINNFKVPFVWESIHCLVLWLRTGRTGK